MGFPEEIGNRLARNEQAGSADERQFLDHLGMADGDFGGKPTADIASDKIESVELQGVENLEIMEDDVLDGFHLVVFIGIGTARVRRGDHFETLCQIFVKGQRLRPGPEKIRESMEIHQRRAVAVLIKPDRAAAYIDAALAHSAAPNSARSSS